MDGLVSSDGDKSRGWKKSVRIFISVNFLRKRRKCGLHSQGKRNNGELPMYYVERTHPAIISREVFDRAQKEMAARYGVEVKNGRAETAGYLYHGGD